MFFASLCFTSLLYASLRFASPRIAFYNVVWVTYKSPSPSQSVAEAIVIGSERALVLYIAAAKPTVACLVPRHARHNAFTRKAFGAHPCDYIISALPEKAPQPASVTSVAQ